MQEFFKHAPTFIIDLDNQFEMMRHKPRLKGS
jgi:hypothetical protein